jgi:hypothetical protein
VVTSDFFAETSALASINKMKGSSHKTIERVQVCKNSSLPRILPACTTNNKVVILQEEGESVIMAAAAGERPSPSIDRTEGVGEPGHERCDIAILRPRSLHVRFSDVIPENTLPSPAACKSP